MATLTADAIPPPYVVSADPDPAQAMSLLALNGMDDHSSNGSNPNLPASEPLPAYASPSTGSAGIPRSSERAVAGTKDFEYKIEKAGKTIVCMTIIAGAAYSKNIPTFYGGGPVKGKLCLNLEQPETIQSVIVSIHGRFLSGAEDENIVFMNISQTLWSHGSPAPNPDQMQPPVANSKGKLQGNYTWTFSMDIPKEVSIPSPGKNRNAVSLHAPPHTFNERGLRGSMRYEVSVRIGRGKLRTDHRISTPFGFIPIVRAPPFLPLKLLAYQEGTPLMDPSIDPEGWHSSGDILISGTLFKARAVEMKCNLFISKPLAYTRGSVIPLYLQLRSKDEQFADLVSSSKAIVVRLRRKIKFHVPQNQLKTPDNYHIARGKDIVDVVEAVWWPATSQEQSVPNGEASEHTRLINGELHLRTDLQPTSTIPFFKIEYSVIFCSFSIAGFEMSTTEQVLLEQPVDIVTFFAPGPRATRFAPPGYNSERQIPRVAPGLMLSSSGFI